MDKTAQAARQARLAQALRTNLRRRKSGDTGKPVAGEPSAGAAGEAREPAVDDAAPVPASSEAGSAT